MPDPHRADERTARRIQRMERERADAYTGAVRRELVRILGASRSAFDADDIASLVVVRLLERLAFFMNRYPEPGVFARAVHRNAVIDFDRTQNAQRGLGARAERGPDGTVRSRRSVISGDAPLGEEGATLFDSFLSGDDPFERLIERLDAEVLAERMLSGIPAVEAEALFLAEGHEMTHAEIGAATGVTRETACRRANRGKDAAAVIEAGGGDA